MNNQKSLIIPAKTLELGHFLPDAPLSIHVGGNTLVVVPESMTAMEAVQTIAALDCVITELLDAFKSACGTCEEQMAGDGCPGGSTDPNGHCPYKEHRGPRIVLRDDVREEMGLSPDAKVDCYVDEGEALVTAADYEHDISDVPENVRTLLAIAGVCPGRLDGLLMEDAEAWHG